MKGAWHAWKEGKLWLQSTNKAKHKNGKGILNFGQRQSQQGSRVAVFGGCPWNQKCSFVFSPLC